jgi:type I restriction enzyme S subunit
VFGSNGVVGSHDETLVQGDCIIVGRKGSVGAVHHAKGPSWPIDTTYYIDDLHHMPIRFWYFALKYLDLGSLNRATAIPGLNRTDAYKVALALPPPHEQQRIADKLDALLARVDACRERLDRVPAILKRFRQSVLAAATSSDIQADLEGNERPQPRSAFRPLADGIEEFVTGPFGSALHKSDYVVGGIPLVNPMHINRGVITPSAEMAVSPAKARELSQFALREGDVVIARRGVMGRCAVVTLEQDGWLCGTGSMVLRPKAELDSQYLQMFLSSPTTVAMLEADAVGSTMVNLNQRILLALRIVLPSLDRQQAIVRQVEALFAYADRVEARYAAARAQVERLTPALLAKAFRGELVPQDPDDEPASVVLERIRAARAAAPPKPRSRQGTGRQMKTHKAEILMLNRRDIPDAHLFNILRERGPLTAEALWSASQLDIDDFYDQLQDEEARGLLKECRGDAPTMQRLLAAAA